MSKKILVAVTLLCASMLSAQFLDLRLAGANAQSAYPALQPQLCQSGRHSLLALTARFLNDAAPRAAWDFPIDENLAHCAGVKLRLFCQRPELIRQFSIYLKTGNVWYGANFAPFASNGWQEVFIPKADFMPESTTASWQNAKCLRIALWKGALGAPTLHVASIEFVRPNCPVAIIRSGIAPKETNESYRYASCVSAALTGMGARPAVLEQPDTTYLNLRPYSLVILPMPSAAGSSQLAILASFLQRKGKAIAFHALPPILQQSLGMPTGRYMAMPGLGGVQFLPGRLPGASNFQQASESLIAVSVGGTPVRAVWYDVNGRSTGWPAVIESPRGFWMTQAFLNKDPANASAALMAMAAKCVPALQAKAAQTQIATAYQRFFDCKAEPTAKSEAMELLSLARRQYEQGHYMPANLMARDCMEALSNVSLNQTPASGPEIRGVWADCDTGLPGSTWENTAGILANANLNAVFMQSSSPLLANYKSIVIPRYKATRALENCIAACRRHGLQTHAWMCCMSLENARNIPQLQAMRDYWMAQGQLQISSEGESLSWLCPSQIRNRTIVVRMAAELAINFKLDGIMLDFIRFPQSNSCICRCCQRAFESFIGQPCNWPVDVLPGGTQHQHWLAFRRALMTTLVRDISNAVHQVKPQMKLTAAVYPDLASARKNIGQDWLTWLKQGYVDAVSPMNYQPSTQAFEGAILRQNSLLHTPRKQLLPSIGMSVNALSLNDVKQQILVTRKQQNAGFILFKLGRHESRDILTKIFR